MSSKKMKYINFGKRLKAFIDEEGLNNSSLADIIKVDKSQVGRWIEGENLPSGEPIKKLAKSFPYLDITWLFTGVGQMYKSKEVENLRNEINATLSDLNPLDLNMALRMLRGLKKA